MSTTSPVMNHTQTLVAWSATATNRTLLDKIARHINAQDKPCPVFLVRNGDKYEIRPTSSVSRRDFNALFSIAEKALEAAGV